MKIEDKARKFFMFFKLKRALRNSSTDSVNERKTTETSYSETSIGKKKLKTMRSYIL